MKNLAALPSLAMSQTDAAIYIGGYIGSSLALMTVFGAVIGWCARTIGIAWLPRALAAVGVVTVAIGIWWLALAFGLL